MAKTAGGGSPRKCGTCKWWTQTTVDAFGECDLTRDEWNRIIASLPPSIDAQRILTHHSYGSNCQWYASVPPVAATKPSRRTKAGAS